MDLPTGTRRDKTVALFNLAAWPVRKHVRRTHYLIRPLVNLSQDLPDTGGTGRCVDMSAIFVRRAGTPMIRRSILVGVMAVLMSLLLHGLGLSITSREAQPEQGQENPVDVADVGGAFEDFTEAVAEPAQPEAAQVPDVPEVTPPTSRALVASDNPQDVTAPDTGLAEAIEPDSAAPGGGEDDTVADVAAEDTASDRPGSTGGRKSARAG